MPTFILCLFLQKQFEGGGDKIFKFLVLVGSVKLKIKFLSPEQCIVRKSILTLGLAVFYAKFLIE